MDNKRFDSIIVHGHKEYYPKFGFTGASNWSIKYPFEVPEETVSIRVGEYYETTDKHRFSGSSSAFICVHLRLF